MTATHNLVIKAIAAPVALTVNHNESFRKDRPRARDRQAEV